MAHLSFIKLISICLLIITAFGQVAKANLILNGDFESPSGGLGRYLGGSTAISGWTVLGNDVDLLTTNYSETSNGMFTFNAESGLQSIDLTGNGNNGPTNGITQSIPTVTGTHYALSFYVGSALSTNGTSSYQPPGAVDGLSIDGGPIIPFTSRPIVPGQITWTGYTYSFTATGPVSTISFLNATPLNTSLGELDNVSVVAVPEPIVAGICLAIIPCLSRRRTA